MSYLTHLMGDSVLQASLQEVLVIVAQRRVFPAFLPDLCTVCTSGGFENLRDGWRSRPGCVLPWLVLPMGQLHCKLPPVRITFLDLLPVWLGGKNIAVSES